MMMAEDDQRKRLAMINDDVELQMADKKYNFQMMMSDWPMSIIWRNDHGR